MNALAQKQLAVSVMLAIGLAGVALPPGSALGADPRVCGDVVGRDLWVQGNKLGHVGIFDGSKVLEVNNGGGPVIRKVSLSDFKKATRYWGAKYFPECANFRKVIDAGWEQSYWAPRYAFTGGWQVGGYGWRFVPDPYRRNVTGTMKQVRHDAVMRCDVFVCYAYQQGLNKSLWGGRRPSSLNPGSQLPSPSMPLAVYSRVSCTR